jgi:hypothetical protein
MIVVAIIGILAAIAYPSYEASVAKSRRKLATACLTEIAQSAERGVLPILYAATAGDVEGGAYYGPRGMGGMRGPPHREPLPPGADDDAAAARLWEASERLTGVRFA